MAEDQSDYVAARALFDESLALYRAIGNKSGITMALENLGNTTVEQGDDPTARTYYVEGMQLAHDIGDKLFCACGLNGLAATARSDQPQRAARLAAATETLRKAIDVTWAPAERRIYELTLAAARAALSEAEFAAAWAAGSAMTLGEAVAYALGSDA